MHIDQIQNRIITIREVPVMLDNALAEIYKIETRTLKQAVRRNRERFPHDFMFELTINEIEVLVSQSVIPSKSYFGGATPFAFTEQGVAMLSSVLKSSIAIEINIKIMRAFVEMKRFMTTNAGIFQRLDKVEQKQIGSDIKFEKIFKALEDRSIKPRQGIFFNGQVFDAYKFVSDLIRSAKKSITLIDNYIDDSVLTLLSKKKKNVKVTILTKNISRKLALDIKKFNEQYPAIIIEEFNDSHDRFIIIDEKDLYHFGASLKDMGKKWFAFSKMDIEAISVISKLKNKNR